MNLWTDLILYFKDKRKSTIFLLRISHFYQDFIGIYNRNRVMNKCVDLLRYGANSVLDHIYGNIFEH